MVRISVLSRVKGWRQIVCYGEAAKERILIKQFIHKLENDEAMNSYIQKVKGQVWINTDVKKNFLISTDIPPYPHVSDWKPSLR